MVKTPEANFSISLNTFSCWHDIWSHQGGHLWQREGLTAIVTHNEYSQPEIVNSFISALVLIGLLQDGAHNSPCYVFPILMKHLQTLNLGRIEKLMLLYLHNWFYVRSKIFLWDTQTKGSWREWLAKALLSPSHVMVKITYIWCLNGDNLEVLYQLGLPVASNRNWLQPC